MTESCSTSRSRMLSSRLLAMVMLIVYMSLDRTSNRQNCKCSHLYPSGCSWYDQVICDGEVVRDLYRWWFQSRCSNSRWTGGETSSSNCNHIHLCLTKSIPRIHSLFLRMSVISRSWSEVRADPRFRP